MIESQHAGLCRQHDGATDTSNQQLLCEVAREQRFSGTLQSSRESGGWWGDVCHVSFFRKGGMSAISISAPASVPLTQIPANHSGRRDTAPVEPCSSIDSSGPFLPPADGKSLVLCTARLQNGDVYSSIVLCTHQHARPSYAVPCLRQASSRIYDAGRLPATHNHDLCATELQHCHQVPSTDGLSFVLRPNLPAQSRKGVRHRLSRFDIPCLPRAPH